MQRQPRQNYRTSYPRKHEFTGRRWLRDLGAMAGAAALTANLGGCNPGLLNMLFSTGGVARMPACAQDQCQASLPARPETHTLYFGEAGSIDYHLEMTLRVHDYSSFVEQNPDRLLDIVDVSMSDHDMAAFAEGADLAAIEAEIARLLTEDYSGSEDPDTLFQSLFIVVDAFDEAQPGD